MSTSDANPLSMARKGNQLYLRSSRTILPRTRPFSLPFAARRARRFSNINLRICLNIFLSSLSFLTYILYQKFFKKSNNFCYIPSKTWWGLYFTTTLTLLNSYKALTTSTYSWSACRRRFFYANSREFHRNLPHFTSPTKSDDRT